MYSIPLLISGYHFILLNFGVLLSSPDLIISDQETGQQSVDIHLY